MFIFKILKEEEKKKKESFVVCVCSFILPYFSFSFLFLK